MSRRQLVIQIWRAEDEYFFVTRVIKNACSSGDLGTIPGWGDPLEKGMAIHSSILAWRIPWTEGLDGLWSIGSQRIGHN